MRTKAVAVLPIVELAEGPICPPLDPDHASWDIVAPWDDPLASRGGYRVPSLKKRVTINGAPAIEWEQADRNDRSFITGEPTWREYALSCRVQPLQDAAATTYDEPSGANARAGLVFRMETVRRYYTFCVENRRRLVLYRRNDDEWVELAARDIELADALLTLRVALDADAIRAECPELGVAFDVTDTSFRAGMAGFRALGACRLFSLDAAMTPGREALNSRLAAALASRTARLSATLPDEAEIGAIELSGGRTLAACTDFHTTGRNDLLFSTPEGMMAETWEGRVLWQLAEPLANIVFSADPVDGKRVIYALTGSRGAGEKRPALTVTGQTIPNIVQDEIVVIDGATGAIRKRAKLPVSPRQDLIRKYDLSFETGRISGATATDVLVREWRSDWGDGGETIWAFDRDLTLLWRQTVHPGYGHHNAVHFCDINGDGRDEILAGGNMLSPDGALLWRHDQADAFFHTIGGQHYDAAIAGHFADDPEIDPCAFLAGGSAGVYVVDALTGRTRSLHRIGHAQWCLPCKVREDLPGSQILAGTRWDNFGIMTLFSGRGDRLWSIQPDYILQGSLPVQWTRGGIQHIWCCRSMRAMGLYDGFGRLVKPLDKIRKLYEKGTKKPTMVLRRTPDGPDLLGIQIGDTMRLFGANA